MTAVASYDRNWASVAAHLKSIDSSIVYKNEQLIFYPYWALTIEYSWKFLNRDLKQSTKMLVEACSGKVLNVDSFPDSHEGNLADKYIEPTITRDSAYNLALQRMPKKKFSSKITAYVKDDFLLYLPMWVIECCNSDGNPLNVMILYDPNTKSFCSFNK